MVRVRVSLQGMNVSQCNVLKSHENTTVCVCVCVCAQSGCGTVVLVEDQTAVHSPNYPQFYSNGCVLRWVVHAPQGHVVKVMLKIFRWIKMKDWKLCCQQSKADYCVVFQLDFADFYLEESDRCLYDSLTILSDVEGTEEIGRRTQSKTRLKLSCTSFIKSFSLFLFVLLCLCLSPCMFFLLYYFKMI